LHDFLGAVDWCFCGVFREFGRANVVFLHGKCGEVVVDCVATDTSKSALKNETGSRDLFWLTCPFEELVQER
jgi:hypothetical protein